MSDPYVGEVRLVGFNFAPDGWAFCNGQLLSISQYGVLYNLIGTTYGGDGQSTFGLPNLQGRIPIHQGTLQGGGTYVLGQPGGVETVTVQLAQYPSHSHSIMGTSNSGSSNSQSNNTVGGISAYTPDAPITAMNGAMIGYSGSSGPHNNVQPYQVLNWIISLFGVYPSPN